MAFASTVLDKPKGSMKSYRAATGSGLEDGKSENFCVRGGYRTAAPTHWCSVGGLLSHGPGSDHAKVLINLECGLRNGLFLGLEDISLGKKRSSKLIKLRSDNSPDPQLNTTPERPGGALWEPRRRRGLAAHWR